MGLSKYLLDFEDCDIFLDYLVILIFYHDSEQPFRIMNYQIVSEVL